MSRADCLAQGSSKEYLSNDIKIQRKRIGGDFVIARAIAGSKEERDKIRKILPDCIFLILTLTKEMQEERLLARHGDGKAGEGVIKLLTKFHDAFGLPEEGEENTFNIDIKEDMTPEDVLKIALEKLEGCEIPIPKQIVTPSIQSLDKKKSDSKVPLKKGYYYSKQATNELMKIDDDFKVWILPLMILDFPVLLDYPEVKHIGTGSFDFGDYGHARKEIQEALNDSTLSTVRTLIFRIFCKFVQYI